MGCEIPLDSWDNLGLEAVLEICKSLRSKNMSRLSQVFKTSQQRPKDQKASLEESSKDKRN